MFLAGRRNVIEAVGFDSTTFDGFHHYDLDLSFSAYLAGFRLAVVNDLPIIHASAGNRDEVWRRYCARFVAKYGPHLPSQPERTYTTGWVYVQTKGEVVDVMEETYRSSLR